MTPERIFIALGSNLGDRRANLEFGIESAGRLESTRVRKVSALRWTAPWGLREQPWFLNAAAELESALSPRDLLAALLEIEARAGRSRSVPNGPRTLDLDLLLYGSRILVSDGVEIPHPRMCSRRFVLGPLAEIAPEFVHPVEDAAISELLARLPAGDEAVPLLEIGNG